MSWINIYKSYVNQWHVPPLTCLIVGIIACCTSSSPYWLVLIIGVTLLSIATLASFALSIRRCWLKQYKHGAYQLSTTGIILVPFMAWYALHMIMPRYDYYANFLSIPDDIEIHEPWYPHKLDGNFVAVPIPDTTNCTEEDFWLINSFQPGLYQYQACIAQADSGQLYFKAYEVTHNDGLRLSEGMLIEVNNRAGELQRYKSEGHFTVYEGDWGQPYAARFELWFYSAKRDTSILVKSKNYKIEGWMR